MSINLQTREFINVDAQPGLATLAFGKPTATIVGTPNFAADVNATQASLTVASFDASAQNEIRVFPPVAAITPATYTATIEGTTATVNTEVNASTASMRVIAGNTSLATGQPISNYPNVTCGFAIGNGSTRRTNEPSKTNLASKTFGVHQMIGFTSSQMETRYQEWQGLYDINPYQVHVPHIDYHGIGFDEPGSQPSSYWHEDLVYADCASNPSNFDNWIATGYINRAQYTAGPFTSMQSFDHHLSYRWDAPNYVHEATAQRQWEQWTNDDDPLPRSSGGKNLARDFNFGIMQDTLGQFATNVIHWFPEYEGTIQGTLNQQELVIDTWSRANGYVSDPSDHFGGSPDAQGYTPNLHELQLIIVRDDRTTASANTIVGHKAISGTQDAIKLGEAPNFTLGFGDSLWVKVRQFQTNPTDKTSGIWGNNNDDYHNGVLYCLNQYTSLQASNYGLNSGVYSNQGSQNWLVKNGGGSLAAQMPTPTWVGQWDGIHWEHADRSMGFTTDSGYNAYYVSASLHRGGNNYNPDWLPAAIAGNRSLLKSNVSSTNGYPCLWWNIEWVRRQSSDVTTRYQLLTELDAAFVRFWSLFCWCCDNVAPQAEMGPHADPVMIDEEIINFGDPIGKRDFWINWDPLGDNGRGTYDWRTPDFGTHGYFFEFENCLIQINLRPPTNTSIAWVPNWLPGGQEIDPDLDRGILPSAGDGFKWQAFSRYGYVNDQVGSQYFGKSPTDYDSTYIMKDDTLNNGYDRNAHFDTGALEAVVHMRVPTTEAPVTVTTASRTLFRYKERAMQLFGHQHIRINVDQATEKDMPAVMGPGSATDNAALTRYMDYVANRGMNNIRLWPYFASSDENAVGARASPLPWNRPGPGLAGDGGARFDVNQLNQEYFDRIDSICQAAYERDIIVTILFWDVYSFSFSRQDYNPLTNRAHTNNVNSIEVDANNAGYALDNMYDEPVSADVTAVQVAYEQKLIDTVNQYPNIVYEVNNESGELDHQVTVMDRIRSYQDTKPNQHLIAITAGGLTDSGSYTNTVVSKTNVKATTCDWICPGTDKFGATWGDTDDSSGNGPPLQDDLTRPWVLDMDHIQDTSTGTRDPSHFWKGLTRGYGYNHFEGNFNGDPILATPYSALGWEEYMVDTAGRGWNILRYNIGIGRKWFNDNTKDPLLMIPSDNTSVASTQYVIADPGEDYIVFSLTDSTPTIFQLQPGETYRVKWCDATAGAEYPGTTTFVASGTSQTLTAPFTLGAEGAAVHVWRIS